MLDWDDDSKLVRAVTTCGVRMTNPAALPGCDLTVAESAEVLERGWTLHEGTWYSPAMRTNGTLDGLKAHSVAAREARAE